MDAFKQRLQLEASSRLEPYSREVFLSVGIKDSSKLLVRPLQFQLIDSYPVMSAQKCARQSDEGKWVNLFKSKVVYHSRKPGQEGEPPPPSYLEIEANAAFCEQARLLPFEASVFKKHMQSGKDVPQYYLDLFRKEEAIGGPKLTDPITYVGLSGVLDIDELMFNRDAYYVTFGIDPLSFYTSRPAEDRLKMEAAFPASKGLSISDYNFEASCPPALAQRYHSFLPSEIKLVDASSTSYPVMLAEDFFADLDLHKYHPDNEEFRSSSAYRREFDWTKNKDYIRTLKSYVLAKVSESLQKTSGPSKSASNQTGNSAQRTPQQPTAASNSQAPRPKSGILDKLKGSSELFRPADSAASSVPPIDTDEINRDFSESLAEFDAERSSFYTSDDSLPTAPLVIDEEDRRSVMGLSDLKRSGKSFSSAAKDMGVEKTPALNTWVKDKKPLPSFSVPSTKATKSTSAPAWATSGKATPTSPSSVSAVDDKAVASSESRNMGTSGAKKPSLLGLLQTSREVAPPTPTSSMSM